MNFISDGMNSIVGGIKSKLPAHLVLSAALAGMYAVAVIANVIQDNPNETFNDMLIGAGVVIVAYCVLVAYTQLKYGARRKPKADS